MLTWVIIGKSNHENLIKSEIFNFDLHNPSCIQKCFIWECLRGCCKQGKILSDQLTLSELGGGGGHFMTTTLLPCGPAMLSRLKLSGDLPQDHIHTKFKLIAHKFDICVAEITSDLAKKSREYSWDNIAGPCASPDFQTLQVSWFGLSIPYSRKQKHVSISDTQCY